ncbi:unnamed protein product [Amoebophrya sp. A25]|nr:unnamed protein product [Amoebophrya sp. A25]|eukprot:GSA25T00013846001.1
MNRWRGHRLPKLFTTTHNYAQRWCGKHIFVHVVIPALLSQFVDVQSRDNRKPNNFDDSALDDRDAGLGERGGSESATLGLHGAGRDETRENESSNRAEKSTRAHHIKHNLRDQHPDAFLLETDTIEGEDSAEAPSLLISVDPTGEISSFIENTAKEDPAANSGAGAALQQADEPTVLERIEKIRTQVTDQHEKTLAVIAEAELALQQSSMNMKKVLQPKPNAARKQEVQSVPVQGPGLERLKQHSASEAWMWLTRISSEGKERGTWDRGDIAAILREPSDRGVDLLAVAGAYVNGEPLANRSQVQRAYGLLQKLQTLPQPETGLSASDAEEWATNVWRPFDELKETIRKNNDARPMATRDTNTMDMMMADAKQDAQGRYLCMDVKPESRNCKGSKLRWTDDTFKAGTDPTNICCKHGN